MLIRKILIFLLFIPITALMAGIYGILHDQLTYTIGPEYFTKFKFNQFHLQYHIENGGLPPRLAVALVGFLATWWVGLTGGIILGSFGFIHNTGRQMFKSDLFCLLVALLVAFVTGLSGLVYGSIIYGSYGLEHYRGWFLPADLADPKAFILVGNMHNFSYLGGLLGLLAGIFWQFRLKRKYKKQSLPSA